MDNAHNEARTGRRLHGVADLAVQCIDRAASLHRSWSEPRPAEPVDPEVKRTGAYRPACGMALEGGPIRSPRKFFVVFSHMSEAIERIVGAYVKLGNRKALEDMKVHRQRLITELKSAHGAFDLSLSIKQLDDEIAVIELGLWMLNTAAAA